MMKFYFKSGYTQDGKLDSKCGRIVIYENHILLSLSNADHNYLLRGLSSKAKINKNKVISNAIRLYFRITGDKFIVSEVRKIDYDSFFNNLKKNSTLIKREFKKNYIIKH